MWDTKTTKYKLRAVGESSLSDQQETAGIQLGGRRLENSEWTRAQAEFTDHFMWWLHAKEIQISAAARQ